MIAAIGPARTSEKWIATHRQLRLADGQTASFNILNMSVGRK